MHKEKRMNYENWLFLVLGIIGLGQGIKGVYDYGKWQGERKGWERGWNEADELHETFDKLRKQVEEDLNED